MNYGCKSKLFVQELSLNAKMQRFISMRHPK